MKRPRIPGSLASVLLTFTALGVSLIASSPVGAAGRGIEGRWLLVEQTYGEGKANLVSADEPIILELHPGAGDLAGRWLAPSKGPSEGRIWPAWIAEGRPLPVQVLEKAIDAGSGRLHASYLVAPSEGDATILEVEESYELDGAEGSLTGTVKVIFRSGDETRGSYVLHRRFERVE